MVSEGPSLLRTSFMRVICFDQVHPSNSFPIFPILSSHFHVLSPVCFVLFQIQRPLSAASMCMDTGATAGAGQHCKATPLKETDYPHPWQPSGAHSHQLPAAPRLGVVFPTIFPFHYGCFLASSCTGLVHDVTGPVSSYAQLPCMSEKQLSSHNPSPSLPLSHRRRDMMEMPHWLAIN